MIIHSYQQKTKPLQRRGTPIFASSERVNKTKESAIAASWAEGSLVRLDIEGGLSAQLISASPQFTGVNFRFVMAGKLGLQSWNILENTKTVWVSTEFAVTVVAYPRHIITRAKKSYSRAYDPGDITGTSFAVTS